jgi:hypothetical protein
MANLCSSSNSIILSVAMMLYEPKLLKIGATIFGFGSGFSLAFHRLMRSTQFGKHLAIYSG